MKKLGVLLCLALMSLSIFAMEYVPSKPARPSVKTKWTRELRDIDKDIARMEPQAWKRGYPAGQTVIPVRRPDVAERVRVPTLEPLGSLGYRRLEVVTQELQHLHETMKHRKLALQEKSKLESLKKEYNRLYARKLVPVPLAPVKRPISTMESIEQDLERRENLEQRLHERH